HGDLALGPKAGDVVIDAGACFGDTAVFFAKAVGSRGHIYAFDPLPSHGAVVLHNIRQNGLEDRITYLDLAVGESVRQGSSAVAAGGGANPGFSLVSGSSAVAMT